MLPFHVNSLFVSRYCLALLTKFDWAATQPMYQPKKNLLRPRLLYRLESRAKALIAFHGSNTESCPFAFGVDGEEQSCHAKTTSTTVG